MGFTTDRACIQLSAARATKASGLKAVTTDLGGSAGQTGASTKGTGANAKNTAREHVGKKTEQYTKENGQTANTTEWGSLQHQTERS